MMLETYPDREALVLGLANRLVGDLAAALRQNDRVSFCVPGGTSPGPVFDILSGADLDWGRVDVLLSDERWVPEQSERSNTRLIRERLLTGRAAAARLVPLHADTAMPEEALAGLAAAIEPLLPLDVLLLGMGADMHTASLFPGADRLAEALSPAAPILVAMRAPGAPEPRVTLSAPVLAGAMACHILITGDEKRAALDRARALPPDQAPVAAVLAEAVVHWAQ